jgi:hypothetical protein
MKRTSEERFKILISTVKRYERACESKNGQGLDHDLSNVRCFPSHIEISLKDGKVFELTGSVIRLAGFEVELENVLQVHWITNSKDSWEKAKLKRNKYDCIYIQTHQELLSVEGMGQSVFPVMKFINWAITYG